MSEVRHGVVMLRQLVSGGPRSPCLFAATRWPPVGPIIPIGEGEALLNRGMALGGQAELIVYPGANHGFDWDPNSHIASLARGCSVLFFRRQLDGQRRVLIRAGLWFRVLATTDSAWVGSLQ